MTGHFCTVSTKQCKRLGIIGEPTLFLLITKKYALSTKNCWN